MTDTVVSFILENYPAMGVVVLLLIVCCVVTWKARAFYDASKKINEKVEQLPCLNHKDDIERIKATGGKIDDISNSIRKIEEWIIRWDVGAMSDLIRKCSPYQLTELGSILLEMSAGMACINTHAERLIDKIEKTNPKTAYDVEQNSLSVLSDLTNDEMFNPIKNFLYKSPEIMIVKTSKGDLSAPLTMQRILMMMSIYLRDKYFQKHTEMDLSDFYNKKEEHTLG